MRGSGPVGRGSECRVWVVTNDSIACTPCGWNPNRYLLPLASVCISACLQVSVMEPEQIPDNKSLGIRMRGSGPVGPLLHRNIQRFRSGLVFKARRLLYHSTLGLRVIKKKKKNVPMACTPCGWNPNRYLTIRVWGLGIRRYELRLDHKIRQ